MYLLPIMKVIKHNEMQRKMNFSQSVEPSPNSNEQMSLFRAKLHGVISSVKRFINFHPEFVSNMVAIAALMGMVHVIFML